MLSSVTLNCQVTMIVMNSGYQLSEMSTISHKFTSHVKSLYLYLVFGWVINVSTSLIKCLKGHKSPAFRIALWRCSLNVFVIVFVFVVVFVFSWSGHASSSVWSNVSKVSAGCFSAPISQSDLSVLIKYFFDAPSIISSPISRTKHWYVYWKQQGDNSDYEYYLLLFWGGGAHLLHSRPYHGYAYTYFGWLQAKHKFICI